MFCRLLDCLTKMCVAMLVSQIEHFVVQNLMCCLRIIRTFSELVVRCHYAKIGTLSSSLGLEFSCGDLHNSNFYFSSEYGPHFQDWLRATTTKQSAVLHPAIVRKFMVKVVIRCIHSCRELHNSNY